MNLKTSDQENASIGAVVIGRNEGERLRLCLSSLVGQVEHLVYVDSGSDDGSVLLAKELGATVVELDMRDPFTAARARNAGTDALSELMPNIDFVQFVDGDCEVRADWLKVAARFLTENEEFAITCGRRRERFPNASVYNKLIDREWDTPVGEAKSCGGDALMRLSALRDVNGYNPNLIAGEEPELCVRLRQKGWKIARLDAEMTWHDAALNRFGQWWTRTKRGGHAFAEGYSLHGAPPERHFRQETIRAVAWGGILPVAILAFGAITPWAGALFAIWPIQIIRLKKKGEPWFSAVFLTLAKFPEAQGCAQFLFQKLAGRRSELIEYK